VTSGPRTACLVGDELEGEGDVASPEAPIDQMFFGLQILSQRIEHRALVGVGRIAVVDKVDQDLVDRRLVLV
jgi:hypothetical protein